MKISKKLITIITVALFVITAVSVRQSSVKNQNELRVGTSCDYPPYTTIENNKIMGFDIDLIEQVGQCIGKKIILVDLPFSGLIFGLLSGDIDLIASAMSPTERRIKFVRFTDNYISGDSLVIVSKKYKPYNSIAELQGKVVVVNTGFVADTYMTGQSGIELTRLKTPADALMALQSGSVNAWVCAQSSADAFLSKIADGKQQYQSVPIPETGDDYAFVVNKYNESLAEQVNHALMECRSSGILDQLKEKWKLS